jgi:hypothetical protein
MASQLFCRNGRINEVLKFRVRVTGQKVKSVSIRNAMAGEVSDKHISRLRRPADSIATVKERRMIRIQDFGICLIFHGSE